MRASDQPVPAPVAVEPPPVPASPATPADLAARGYRAAADAPETLRAYRADLACFRAWCAGEGRRAMPASPTPTIVRGTMRRMSRRWILPRVATSRA